MNRVFPKMGQAAAACDAGPCECNRCRFTRASLRCVACLDPVQRARASLLFTKDDEERLRAYTTAISLFSSRTIMTTRPGHAPSDDLVAENERLADGYESLADEMEQKADNPAMAVESKRRQDKRAELSFRTRELSVRRDRALAGDLGESGREVVSHHDRRLDDWCQMAEDNPVWSDALYDEAYRRVSDFNAALAKLGY